MKKTIIIGFFLVLSFAFGLLGNAFAISVTATVTADNHYAIFFGTDTSLTYVGTNESGSSGAPGTYNWSNAENWKFDVPAGQYIYVVGWSDDSVAQGWKGEFVTSNGTIFSDSSWQYLLSSNNLDDGSAPPLATAVVNTIIANQPWQTGVNTNAYSGWGTVGGLESSAAQWIWGSSMFPGSSFGEYQVFRHAAIPEPATMLLFGLGLVGLAGAGRKFKK